MDEAWILRALYKNDEGKLVVESFHMFDNTKDLMETIEKLEPDGYQCFTATDITNEIFYEVERKKDEAEVAKRKKEYEKLKKEFG